MFRLIEFERQYPNYNLGFMANNPLTETEKLAEQRMHLLYRKNKTYQVFGISDKDYQELIRRCKTVTPGFIVEMQYNRAVFHLKLDETCVIGYCVQTRERVAIEQKLFVLPFVIKDDTEEDIERSNAFWEQVLKSREEE